MQLFRNLPLLYRLHLRINSLEYLLLQLPYLNFHGLKLLLHFRALILNEFSFILVNQKLEDSLILFLNLTACSFLPVLQDVLNLWHCLRVKLERLLNALAHLGLAPWALGHRVGIDIELLPICRLMILHNDL